MGTINWGAIKMRLKFAFIILLLLPFCAGTIPAHDGYFTDNTGALSYLDAEIEELCGKLKEANGCELAVLVVNTLEWNTIEDYTNEVFNTWGIGEKENDNGILFLLAIKDRKARIEVGYGLEHIIPDSLAGSFLVEIAVPYFKENNWSEGIKETTYTLYNYLLKNYSETLTGALDSDTTNAGESTTATSTSSGSTTAGYNTYEDRIISNSGFTDQLAYRYIHYYWIPLIIYIGIIIFNISLFIRKKFLIYQIFIAEAAVAGLQLIFSIIALQDYETDMIGSIFFAGVAFFIYLGFFISSQRHKCPKCTKYMDIKSKIIKHPTYSSSGKRRINYKCTNCKYKKTKYAIIPRLTRSTTNSSSSWSSSSSSSSSSWSSSSSFGGGSSGGGGASVGF